MGGTVRAQPWHMMAMLKSCAFSGIDAFPIEVEVDVASGNLPSYHVVGLPTASVREGAVRIRASLEHIGQSMPRKKVTVNLAPADRRKEGAAFDLPIALTVLAAEELLDLERLRGFLVLGELGLDGAVRAVRGVLSAGLMARDTGMQGIIVPTSCAAEAAEVTGIEVLAVNHLSESPRVSWRLNYLREWKQWQNEYGIQRKYASGRFACLRRA